MTDIAKIKLIEQTVEMHYPDTGELLGVRITLVSIDDKRTKALKRAFMNRRQHLEVRGKYMKAEELEENQRTLIFTCMTGWEWYPLKKGEDTTFEGSIPEFNRKNVDAVFDKLPWIEEEIDEALGETKSFFGESKAT